VPEIGLDAASVVAVVGELEPTDMPQHVGMDDKVEFRGSRSIQSSSVPARICQRWP
jgi:hypothetical protein